MPIQPSSPRPPKAREKAPPVDQKQSETPAPAPAIVEHIRYTSRRAPSDKQELPFALQVIIQTDTSITPVALAIECDGEIGDVRFFVAGGGVYMNTYSGVPGPRNDVAVVRFSFPTLTPEAPLVITLLSKTDIKVKQIARLPQ